MKLVDKFLESAAGTLEELSRGTSRPVEPLAVLATGLLPTVFLSFSRSVIHCALGLLASSLLLVVYAPRAAKAWASTLLLLAAGVLIISLPLLFAGKNVTLFVLRTLSSAAYFTAATANIGWQGLSESLTKVGAAEAALDLAVFTRYLPIFLRDAATLMEARESRNLRGRHSVAELSTIIGELMIRAYRRARSLYYAMSARSLGEAYSLHGHVTLSVWDIPHILLAASIIAGWWYPA